MFISKGDNSDLPIDHLFATCLDPPLMIGLLMGTFSYKWFVCNDVCCNMQLYKIYL